MQFGQPPNLIGDHVGELRNLCGSITELTALLIHRIFSNATRRAGVSCWQHRDHAGQLSQKPSLAAISPANTDS